VVQVLFAC